MKKKHHALVLKGALSLLLIAGQPASLMAEGLVLGGKGNRRAAFRAQTALLDGRLSEQYAASNRLRPGVEAEKDVTKLRYSGRYRGEYLDVARAAARKHGVPEDLFLRLVQRESGWNPDVVSSKGAMGLAQLMPGTAALLAVDPSDPADNLNGGARYLAMMYGKFGSWKLALAAYNAGPKAVEDAGGIPEYQETKDYVAAILG
jgi:soluble lytic murein transglycosylase-like protein